MNDTLKMILISLFTALLVQILLGPQLFKYYQSTLVPAAVATTSMPSSSQRIGSQQEQPTLAKPAAKASIQAPDFRGISLSKAQALAHGQGITIIEDSQQFEPQKPIGEILQQTPPPGSSLSDGILHVVTVRTPSELVVPSLINKPFDTARSSLEQAGFSNIKTSEQPSSKTPGTVLAQLPKAGKKVAPNTEIMLEIAALPMIEVPKVTGKYLTQAKAEIEHAGLKVGTVTYREHEEHGQNFVLKQEPEETSKVPFGTAINLVVVAPN